MLASMNFNEYDMSPLVFEKDENLMKNKYVLHFQY